MRPEPLSPGRLRAPRGAYGWIDLRFVTRGWLQRLGPDTSLTYLFLCTVADTRGVSFWGRSRLAQTLGLSPDTVARAFVELVRRDLILTRDHVVQVLPLPAACDPAAELAPTPEPQEAVPPLSPEEWLPFEPQARRQLENIYGSQAPGKALVQALASSLARTAKKATPTSPDAPLSRVGGELRG